MKTKFYAVCSKKGVVNMGDEDYPLKKLYLKKLKKHQKQLKETLK